jgi:hypothetical protein
LGGASATLAVLLVVGLLEPALRFFVADAPAPVALAAKPSLLTFWGFLPESFVSLSFFRGPGLFPL